MRHARYLIALPLLALSFGATARTADAVDQVEELDLPVVSSLEEVDSIPTLAGLHSWTVVDADTLIVWTSPFKPYLVELFRPSRELKFAWSIGITSFGSRIHAKFDSVEVDGFSYPIRQIYKLSREDADALGKRT